MTKVAIRVKANAHYTCQECGATELISAHHEIPGDDDSLVALCAECHSKRHPHVPRGLFFNKGIQPYWHNKSASTLAKEIGVHPRTVIRAAQRLEIPPGELSSRDKKLIEHLVCRIPPEGYLTSTQARKRLGLSRGPFDVRVERGIFPRPTLVDETGIQRVRYFDEGWVQIAQAILAPWRKRQQEEKKPEAA